MVMVVFFVFVLFQISIQKERDKFLISTFLWRKFTFNLGMARTMFVVQCLVSVVMSLTVYRKRMMILQEVVSELKVMLPNRLWTEKERDDIAR